MKHLISNLHQNRHFLYCLLAAVFAYGIPVFGVLMDDTWYKWTYILGSHTIGLTIFLFVFKWYLRKSNGCQRSAACGQLRIIKN
jgi:hypothetical protein